MPFDLKELERLGSQDVPYEHSMELPEYRDPEVEGPAFDLDELRKLGEVELYGEEPGYGRVALKGMARGAQNIASGIGSITRWAGDVMDSPVISEAGRTASEFWREGAQEGWEAPDPRIFSGTFMQKPSLKRAVGIISEAFPSYGAAITASIATGSPVTGAAFLGAIEGAPQYEEAREAGKGLGEASVLGAASTIGTALLEYLPISRMLKFKGGMGKAALRGGLEESAQEATQTVWQNLIAKVGYDDTRNLAEGIIESMIGGFGLGAPGGVVTSRMNRAVEKARQAGATDEEIAAATEDLEKQVEDHAEEIKQSQPVDILEPKTRAPRQAIRIGDQPPPSVFDELAQQENLEAEEELRRQSEAEAQAARFDREPPGTYSREAKATLVAARDFLTTNPNMPFRAKVSLQRQIDDAAGGDPDALYGLWEQIASEHGVEKPAEAMDPEYRERQRQERAAAKARVAGVDEAAQGEPQRATIEGERWVSPAQTGPSVVPQMPGMEQRAAEVDLAAVEAEKLRTGERVSEIDKPVGNSVLANPKLFGDSSNAKALLTKGFELVGRNRQKMILSNVKSALNNPEVFRAVVEAVPVNVMNDLIGEQLAPKDLLHNKSMLTSRLSVPSDVSVPQPVISFIDSLSGFLKERLASGATKKPILPSPDIPASSGEQSAAVVASKKADGGKAPSSILPHVVFSEADSQKLEVNTTPTEAQTQEKEKVRPRTKAQVEAEKPEVEILEGYPVDRLAETEVEVKAIDEKGDVYAVAERADKAIRDIDAQTETYYSILECVG